MVKTTEKVTKTVSEWGTLNAVIFDTSKKSCFFFQIIPSTIYHATTRPQIQIVESNNYLQWYGYKTVGNLIWQLVYVYYSSKYESKKSSGCWDSHRMIIANI